MQAVRRGARVTSLDIGLELLKVAQDKGAQALVQGDALYLPFADGSFDVVISSECIEHTLDGGLAVREMLRVLKSGGYLALSCPNRFWRWAVVLATTVGLRPYGGIEEPPTWSLLEDWIEEAGGTTLHHAGVHALPFQIPFAASILPRLDRKLARAERYFVNQVVLACKPAAITGSSCR
jgi:ubiquinone/menaquinone biosynthesis C-methylase UbiE